MISTPYLDEAERCTRVGLMYRGELIACDDPRKLRDEMRAVVFEAQSEHALRARKLIERSDGVLTVSTHGDLLRVLVDRAERAASIQTAWQVNGIAVSDLRAVKPRLEDAFVLMLQKQEPK